MNRPLSRILGIGLACALASGVSPLLADGPPSAEPRARAQALFEGALEDIEAGRTAAACAKFAASQAADPKTTTLLNLASCYEALDRTASAWASYKEAEVLARRSGRPDLEARARDGAAALAAKLVHLTIEVPAASRTPGLVVTRDGTQVSAAEWGMRVPVDEGDHVVTASAPGRSPARLEVTVRGGARLVTVPVLERSEAEGSPPSVPVAARASDVPSWWTATRTSGIVVASVGAMAAATGLGLGLVANGNYGDARATCGAPPSDCPASAVVRADDARTLARGATVVGLAGAVLLAAGVVIVAVAPSPSRDRRARSPFGLPVTVGLGGGAIAGTF